MRKHIMVYDDDPLTIKKTSHFFKKNGYEVTSAESGCKAISSFLGNEFDLVLCDISESDPDGLLALQAFKAIRPSVKVIIYSGHSFDSIVGHGFHRGVDDYISKTCHVQKLISRVNKWLTV